MFRFVKRVFVVAINVLSFNLLKINLLECVSMNNQECKTRTKIINIRHNEPVFYFFSIKVNKCSDVVIMSMIHMLNCVFQMLLKT